CASRLSSGTPTKASPGFTRTSATIARRRFASTTARLRRQSGRPRCATTFPWIASRKSVFSTRTSMDEEGSTMRTTRLKVAIGLLVAVAAVAIPLTAISIASGGSLNTPEAAAKAATKRFHSLAAAKAAGWKGLVKDKQGITCIDNQPVGGMGVHYANGTYL